MDVNDPHRLSLAERQSQALPSMFTTAMLTSGVFRFLDFPSLDLATPEGRGFLAMFSAMTEFNAPRKAGASPSAWREDGASLQIDRAPELASRQSAWRQERAPAISRAIST
jgi:hypothetical protein